MHNYRIRDFSDESRAIKSARSKLEMEISSQNQQITPQALANKVSEIHSRVSAYLSHRVKLKGKQHLSLFDENRSSAKMSQMVLKQFQELKNHMNGKSDSLSNRSITFS